MSLSNMEASGRGLVVFCCRVGGAVRGELKTKIKEKDEEISAAEKQVQEYSLFWV